MVTYRARYARFLMENDLVMTADPRTADESDNNNLASTLESVVELLIDLWSIMLPLRTPSNLPMSSLQRSRSRKERDQDTLSRTARLGVAVVFVTALITMVFFNIYVSVQEHIVDDNADARATTTTDDRSSTVRSPLQATKTSKLPLTPMDRMDEIEVGVLSKKPDSFFRTLQADIDALDATQRCQRYGWKYNPQKNISRRIFYGTMVAGEPWEVLNIVAAETYNIYTGMVFVEGNRTQNLTPRKFRQLSHGPLLANLFGISNQNMVQVRPFVDEVNIQEGAVDFMDREQRQRQEILHGWIALGMQPTDIGLLADVDESFTRDALRALQTCDDIAELDYETHRCHHSQVKLLSVTRVFEGSPECVTADRAWWHPELMMGHCLEGIGDANMHGLAPRQPGTVDRAPGFGASCDDWQGEDNITTGSYPLWNANDLRKTCGGRQMRLVDEFATDHEKYAAFHVHNFFAQFNHTRFKYQTYGHPTAKAGTEPFYQLNDDMRVVYNCIYNTTDFYPPNPPYVHLPGGFGKAKPFLPIYFYDADYRQRRHEHVRYLINADEVYLANLKAQEEARNASLKEAPLTTS
jgi:Glycosyltransferase family 17